MRGVAEDLEELPPLVAVGEHVQSVDERRHQVFGVKVRVADTQGVFKSGMAAEVTFPF